MHVSDEFSMNRSVFTSFVAYAKLEPLVAPTTLYSLASLFCKNPQKGITWTALVSALQELEVLEDRFGQLPKFAQQLVFKVDDLPSAAKVVTSAVDCLSAVFADHQVPESLTKLMVGFLYGTVVGHT